MEQRLTIDAITPEVIEWTCKVQVVDKFRPGENRDQTIHFQTIIVQDENEEQIAIILYGDDIAKFHNLFVPFQTYLISSAKIREPRSYSIQLNKFEWIVDRFTIVEPVSQDNSDEAPLTAPTKLNALSFMQLDHQRPGVEFDILAVVANCSAIQYTANQTKRYREAIVLDDKKKPFMFTIWDELADNDGAVLLSRLHEHPIILAKRVAVTEYRNVLRLTTRYNSTILLNPQYVQATTLAKWSKDNEKMLTAYTLKTSSASPSSLTLAAVEDDIISISAISSQSSTMQTFPIEGKISLSDHFQWFYMLACSHCNHFVRSKAQREIKCLNCNLQKLLVPRCHFEVNITDSSDSLTARVSDRLAEKILSMTDEQVYQTVAVKNESLSIAHINHQFTHKLFRLLLQKSQFRMPDQKAGTLAISSFSEKEIVLLETLPAPLPPGEGSKKQKIEPPTPAKKQ